jgi:hypothetical protein
MKNGDPYGMRGKSLEELLRIVCGRTPDSLDHQYAQAEIRRRERLPSDRRERIIGLIAFFTLIATIVAIIVTLLVARPAWTRKGPDKDHRTEPPNATSEPAPGAGSSAVQG